MRLKVYLTFPYSSYNKAWWSPIVHCFLLYVAKFEITVAECLEIIIFFSHQCNSTISFTKAFLVLLSRGPKKRKSIYRQLADICLELRIEEDPTLKEKLASVNIEELHDLGCGDRPRFQPSVNKMLSEKEVEAAVNVLRSQIDELSTNDLTKLTDLEILCVVQRVNTYIIGEIKGIGYLRGQMIIQMCALFGLISLNYYTYLPIHLSGGGPENFMTSLMGWQKTDDKTLLQWNVKIVKEMQELFNREFTYNMFENCACEIGRATTPHDVFFKLPYLIHHESEKKVTVSSSKKLQMFFRVDGNRNNEWSLQAFAGGKKKVIIFCDKPSKHKKKPLLQWQRTRDSNLIPPSAKLRIEKLNSDVIKDLNYGKI